jgi:hypothetical protein
MEQNISLGTNHDYMGNKNYSEDQKENTKKEQLFFICGINHDYRGNKT